MGKALRDYYGEALLKYGSDERVVVLDSDVSGSTKSKIFGDKYPERFFNVGIAEENMVAMSAGFAKEGKIPFTNTFAVFLTTNGLLAARTFASYSKLNMKMMGGYGGLSDSYDGPTHHALEDIAVMRSLPNVEVLVASDGVLVDWLVQYCINHNGPVYVRLSRGEAKPVYSEGEQFEIGKAKKVREGGDLTIISCGVMTGESLEAAKLLSEMGIEARVLDMFSIKPIDEQAIIEAANETGAILSVEEHNIIGGLGSAVAEVLVANKPVPQGFVGMKDQHAECGDYGDLFEKYKLNPNAIKEAAIELLKRK